MEDNEILTVKKYKNAFEIKSNADKVTLCKIAVNILKGIVIGEENREDLIEEIIKILRLECQNGLQNAITIDIAELEKQIKSEERNEQ